MTLLDLVHRRDEQEHRFQASLHDKQLPDRDGRFQGVRQSAMDRMKQRRRGVH